MSDALTRDFGEFLVLCQDDPALFAETGLRLRLRKWQADLCRQITERLRDGEQHLRVTARTCHRAGKTHAAAFLTHWWMATRPEARGVTTASRWVQVSDVLWAELRRQHEGSLLRKLHYGEILTTKLSYGPAWFCSGTASDAPERLEGQHSPTAGLRVIDEARSVDDSVYVSTEGILGAPTSADIWISVPGLRTGRFYEREARGDDSVVRCVVTIDDMIADNIAGAAEWKERVLVEWGEDSPAYQARALARYIDVGSDALFPYSFIEKAMSQTWSVDGEPNAGVDVAGSSDGDENVVALNVGPDADGRHEFRIADSWMQRDTMVTAGKCIRLLADHGVRRVGVDSIGVGKGCYDRLAGEFRGVVEEYRASDRAGDPTRFVNLKAETAWRLRDLMEKGLAKLPASSTLKGQMLGMRFAVDVSGRVRVIDPPDSPDHLDAILASLAGAGYWWPASAERADAAGEMPGRAVFAFPPGTLGPGDPLPRLNPLFEDW